MWTIWSIFPLFHGIEDSWVPKWWGGHEGYPLIELILESGHREENSGYRIYQVALGIKQLRFFGIQLVNIFLTSKLECDLKGEPVFNQKWFLLNAFINFPWSLINLLGSCWVISYVPAHFWKLKAYVSSHNGLFRTHFSQLCWKQLHQIPAFWK